MTNLTLKYFVVKARGEVARLILKGSAVPFNDCRYDFSMRPAKNEETNRRLNKHVWPECEFTAAEWLKVKPSTPFQALPLLEGVPGVKGPICQSRAITRHCARIAGIDGNTGKDSAYEFLERVWMKYSVLIGMHGGSMKAEKRWERVDAIPDLMRSEAEDYLTRLEALHVSHFGHGSKFIAGNNLSFADYYWLVTHDYMCHELGYGEMISRCAPNLAKCVENTKNNPNLTEYLEANDKNAYVAMGFAF